MQTKTSTPSRAAPGSLDFRHRILLCSNEPKISEQLMIGSLDKAARLFAVSAQERDTLRAALHAEEFTGAIFDLNYCDESILEIIGQTQKVCRGVPLICISGRQLTGHTLSQNNRTFYYAHSQVPAFALRKMLQQPPLSEPMQFQGVMQTRSLSEVVQLLLFACLSGRLSVSNDSQRGELHVHRGQVVHADLVGRQGYAAALSLLEWTRGTFRFQPGRSSVQTMQLGPHHPLFDPPRRGVPSSEASEASSSSNNVVELRQPSRTPDPTVIELQPVEVQPEPVKSHTSTPPPELPASHQSPLVSHQSPPFAPSMVSQRSTLEELESELVMSVTGEISAPLFIPRALPEHSPPASMASAEFADVHHTNTSGSATTQEPELDQSIKQSWLDLDATDIPDPVHQEDLMAVTANSVKEILSKLELTIEGFIGAAVADSDSGMCVGATGGAGVLNVEVAAAANTEVVRAKRKAMKTLNLRDEIEDILITLGKHYHLIRPLRGRPQLFIYLAVDRTRANLAMARFALADAERDLGV